MTRQDVPYRDWNRSEWASVPAQPPAVPVLSRDDERRGRKHWSKFQWVGDRGHGEPPIKQADEMPEGEGGLSGFRHNPNPQHWGERDDH